MQKNVLLIENDAPFARAVTSALESRGYGVRTTPDGKEGFDLARETRPDCVVLCVELPGLSGYSWCNRLKKDGDLKSIPLVITSAEATEETFDQHRKLKTRAEDYLIKPFPPETLVEHVAALVGESEAPPQDDVIVSMDDVELEGAPAGGGQAPAGQAPVEEDADLRMLDEAFDHISRGSDEPSALAPGAPRSEPPLTLMPDADESPPLSDLDREMAAALASLAEEAAEASKVPPRLDPVVEEDTPILLEDVEILPGPDESAEALQIAREESATLRAEVASLREEGERLRDEGERLHVEGARLREEGDQLRQEGDQLRQEGDRLREEAAQAVASRDAELADLRARIAEVETASSSNAAGMAEASRRAELLDGELAAARAEAEGFQAEIASLRGELNALRGDLDALRDEADGLRAQVDSHASELSRRVEELQGLAAQHQERALQAFQKIQRDEKIREKTRKALAMVLQVLEDRSGGDGGSAPPAAP